MAEPKSKAGRKKVTDLKIQLCIYVPQSTIDLIGGSEKTREYLYHQLKVYENGRG